MGPRRSQQPPFRHPIGRLTALAAVLLAAAAARGAAPAPAAAPPGPPTASPSATPFPPETIAALTATHQADHVIDVLPRFLLLSARRPGPELSYGEPKEVALVIDAEGQLASELDLAWSQGDAGVSVELGHDYLGPGLIRTRVRSSSCDLETNECSESIRFTTYKLSAKGVLEQVAIDGRYCDRGRGEELELVADPDRPLQPAVTYRSKGKPAGLKLRVVEADPTLTRVTVRFPRGAAYTLVLADDFTRLTSAGSDGSPVQTFVRADCPK